MSSNVASFSPPSRHEMSPRQRHDQRRVADMSLTRHDVSANQGLSQHGTKRHSLLRLSQARSGVLQADERLRRDCRAFSLNTIPSPPPSGLFVLSPPADLTRDPSLPTSQHPLAYAYVFVDNFVGRLKNHSMPLTFAMTWTTVDVFEEPSCTPLMTSSNHFCRPTTLLDGNLCLSKNYKKVTVPGAH